MKYGVKYGADYVNKLYWGVKKHLKLKHQFACFTENPEGLDENIKIIDLKASNEEWSGWWSKVNIFNGENYKDIAKADKNVIMYIDLDMIITGALK